MAFMQNFYATCPLFSQCILQRVESITVLREFTLLRRNFNQIPADHRQPGWEMERRR